MSTTMKIRTDGRQPPTEAEVAEIHRLWRDTPDDLYGVRSRFVAWRRGNGDRRSMGIETVIKYRPKGLAWPTREERVKSKWSRRYLYANDESLYSSVADKSSRVRPPRPRSERPEGSRSMAEIQESMMHRQDGDPTPEMILDMAREIRRQRGEPVLLEIDLR